MSKISIPWVMVFYRLFSNFQHTDSRELPHQLHIEHTWRPTCGLQDAHGDSHCSLSIGHKKLYKKKARPRFARARRQRDFIRFLFSRTMNTQNGKDHRYDTSLNYSGSQGQTGICTFTEARRV
jgi:hypothetical protein